MSRRGWYTLILAGMVAFYAFMCLRLDKLGSVTPALLCGMPVWIVTAIVLGLFLLGATRYRPVVNPTEYSETPGCVFTLFIGFFFLAMLLGVVFTEPIVCTARDGDVCYEYSTTSGSNSSQPVYEGYRNDGTRYHYYYRNNWIWFADPAIDTGLSSASWFSDMDLDDSEAAIFIIVVIVLLIIVLSSAFIPNMWVLACALCIGATYLVILRISNEEKAGKRKTDGGLPPDDGKPKNSDPLLADPVMSSNPDFQPPAINSGDFDAQGGD